MCRMNSSGFLILFLSIPLMLCCMAFKPIAVTPPATDSIDKDQIITSWADLIERYTTSRESSSQMVIPLFLELATFKTQLTNARLSPYWFVDFELGTYYYDETTRFGHKLADTLSVTIFEDTQYNEIVLIADNKEYTFQAPTWPILQTSEALNKEINKRRVAWHLTLKSFAQADVEEVEVEVEQMALAALSSQEYIPISMSMMRGGPEDIWMGIQKSTSIPDQIEVAINIPSAMTNALDIFACEGTDNAPFNGIEGTWILEGDSLSVPGGATQLLYTINNADTFTNLILCAGPCLDPDFDTLYSAREILLYRTAPMRYDTDGDNIDDGYEIAYGLNALVKDSNLDPDKDGFSNSEEYNATQQTNPSDPNDTPSPAIYVATNGFDDANGSFTNPLQNISTAINMATNGTRIVVYPGIYTGDLNRNINYLGKAIHIKGQAGAHLTIIDGNNATGVTFDNNETSNSVLSDLSIMNCSIAVSCGNNSSPLISNCILASNSVASVECDDSSPHFFNCRIVDNNDAWDIVYCYLGSPVFENCIIANNRGWFASGIYCYESAPVIKNCTIINNSYGITINNYYATNAVSIENGILWGNEDDQISSSGGDIDISYSCIQDGYSGTGNLTNNPCLSPRTFRLYPASPCIDAGSSNALFNIDIDNEPRWDDPAHQNIVSIVDMGADEYTDTDADGMADGWEQDCFGTLNNNGSSHSDADSISDHTEYIYDTDPINPDTDADFMPDGWEVCYALNPIDGSDMMADPDLDGFGNAYEYGHNTHPTNSSSHPLVTLYVDADAPSGGNGTQSSPFNSIQSALDSASDYEVLQLADGIYSGDGNHDVDFQGQTVMLIASNGAATTIIDCAGMGSGVIFDSFEDRRTVLSGIHIRHAANGAIICSNSSPTIQSCLLSANTNTQPGAAIRCLNAKPAIINCTIADNTSNESGGSIALDSSSEPDIYNTIMWNNTPDQISGFLSVRYSCIQGGAYGTANITNNPHLIEGSYRLKATSPCIDAGIFLNSPPIDMDHEYRTDSTNHSDIVSIVDMGVDEFTDTDGDAMADAWEYQFFGNLLRDGTADGDSDSLNDLSEHNAGSKPSVSDTDNDLLSDGDEVNLYHTSPVNPDTDSDGLFDGNELFDDGTHGDTDGILCNPLLANTDSDSANDALEINCGTDPNNPASFPAYISGRIYTYGNITGNLQVVAVDASNTWTSTHLATLTAPTNYILQYLPTLSNYWIKTYIDSNTNQNRDAGESVGIYNHNAIQLTNNCSNINLVVPDTDNDMLADNWEIAMFGNLTYDGTGDQDNDGLLDMYEFQYGTDPYNTDSDGDTITDGQEVNELGSSPASSSDAAIMLKSARQRMTTNWKMIFQTPLVFTNTPGSSEDLQDMKNALMQISGKFYRSNGAVQ